MQPTRSGVSLLLAMSGQSEPSFGMSEKRRFADVTACTANDDAKAIWTTANLVADLRMGDKKN